MGKSHARYLRECAERERIAQVESDEYLRAMRLADIGAPVMRTSDTLVALARPRLRLKTKRRRVVVTVGHVSNAQWTYRPRVAREPLAYFGRALSDDEAVLYGHLPPKQSDAWEMDKGGVKRVVAWRKGAEAESWLKKD
jgi:hypothetical protein